MRPISPKQISFARTLLAERVHLYDDKFADFTLETYTSKEGSELISELLAAPRIPVEVVEDGAPAGRYAVPDADGVVKFYKVDKPTSGKWAGWTFVKQQVSDDYYPVRDRATKAAILAHIEADPKAAMLLYGREIGACGHCGRTLTDEASRAAGIGPVCAGKVGF